VGTAAGRGLAVLRDQYRKEPVFTAIGNGSSRRDGCGTWQGRRTALCFDPGRSSVCGWGQAFALTAQQPSGVLCGAGVTCRHVRHDQSGVARHERAPALREGGSVAVSCGTSSIVVPCGTSSSLLCHVAHVLLLWHVLLLVVPCGSRPPCPCPGTSSLLCHVARPTCAWRCLNSACCGWQL
jgi:hypothetical protein